MSGYLTKIKTKIPYSDKVVDIDLDGKTLILTGGNGCGKTQLMKYLFTKLQQAIVEKKNYDINQLHSNLESYESNFERLGPADQHYDHYKRMVAETKDKIESVNNPSIEIKNIEEFIVNYQEFKSVLITFEAMRKSDITKPSSVISLIHPLIRARRGAGCEV